MIPILTELIYLNGMKNNDNFIAGEINWILVFSDLNKLNLHYKWIVGVEIGGMRASNGIRATNASSPRFLLD